MYVYIYPELGYFLGGPAYLVVFYVCMCNSCNMAGPAEQIWFLRFWPDQFSTLRLFKISVHDFNKISTVYFLKQLKQCLEIACK